MSTEIPTRAGSPTPERGDIPKPSPIERAFAVDVFERELRAKQQQAWLDLGQERWAQADEVVQYHTRANELAVQYLSDAGVAEDNDKYTDYLETARRYSWDTMDDETWVAGPRTVNNHDEIPVSGRDMLMGDHMRLFGRSISMSGDDYLPSPDAARQNDTEVEPQPRTLEQIEAEINQAADSTNTAFARRMKVGFFRRKKKAELQTDLDNKRQTLRELRQERDTQLIEHWRSEGHDDEKIAEQLADRSNSEITRQSGGQREAMIGTKWYQRGWNKLNEKYANASTGTKIAAGVLTGLALVPVGCAIGVAGATGAATLAGARVWRTYQFNKAKLYAIPQDPPLIEYKKEDDTYKTVDEVRQEAARRTEEVMNQRIYEGDKIKKRAVIVSLGALAIGCGALYDQWDTVKEVASSVKHTVGGWWDTLGGDVQAHSVPSTVEGPSAPKAPEGGGTAPQGQAPQEGSGGQQPSPNLDLSQFTDALRIDHGEGWYNTFEQAGIGNSVDRQALLQDDALMGRLEKMGFAYRDTSGGIGGWGMNLADGRLSPEALKLIRETAQANHYTLAR